MPDLSYVNEDHTEFYYLKDGSLYKADEKDKEKLADNVSSVLRVYDSGDLYYLKSDEVEKTLMDFVEDDMKATDASMREPVEPDYPSYWDYYDFDSYYDAVDRYEANYNAYVNAREAWHYKQERDQLRRTLSGETFSHSDYTLCYHNGKEERVLTTSYADAVTKFAENSPVILFSVYKQSALNKVKLSSITDVSAVYNMVEKALYSSYEYYVAVGGNWNVIDQTDLSEADITAEGDAVYFSADIADESSHGNIYKMAISGNKVQAPELYESDAYDSFYLSEKDQLIYFKDVKNMKGDLYIDKQLIDYDVYVYGSNYIADEDTHVYMVDWNSDKYYGTLKQYKDGQATKIADDVYEYRVNAKGEILYLYDYNITYRKGELRIYKGDESEKIDDDVMRIIQYQ